MFQEPQRHRGKEEHRENLEEIRKAKLDKVQWLHGYVYSCASFTLWLKKKLLKEDFYRLVKPFVL